MRTITSFILLALLPLALHANEWRALLEPSEDTSRVSPQQPTASLNASQRLDQEIIVLRAEMAYENGNVDQVRRYLRQLEALPLSPELHRRVDRLQGFVALSEQRNFGLESPDTHPNVARSGIDLNKKSSVIAMVLPTSGRYAEAGLALQEALQNALTQYGYQGKLVALDSAIYDSAFAMWQILEYYNPNLILGPLNPAVINDWQNLNIAVPTLYFNEPEKLSHYEMSLSPNRQAGIEQVFALLEQVSFEQIAVLYSDSVAGNELFTAFNSLWSRKFPQKNLHAQAVTQTVGEAMDKLFNIEASKNRNQWVKRSLSQPVKVQSRGRADIEVLISLVSPEQSIQINPYLDYLGLSQQIIPIWYPSSRPNLTFLKQHHATLIDSYAILSVFPPLLDAPINEKNDLSQVGLFYALGKVAIEIVKHGGFKGNTRIKSEQVEFLSTRAKQFHLLPKVYWVSADRFEAF